MSSDHPTFSEVGEENVRQYLARKESIAAEKYWDDSIQESIKCETV